MNQVNGGVFLRAKLRRFLTSWLPVSSDRRGECTNCGACCKLPKQCRFLRFRDSGESYCGVYWLRPPSCRKYPRSPSEFITPETCGYYFVDAPVYTALPVSSLKSIPVAVVRLPVRRKSSSNEVAELEVDDELRAKASCR